MNFRFDKKYFLLFLGILIVEIMIVLFIQNETIRGSIGGILTVILLYCFIQAFFGVDKKKTIIGVGILAVLVEISQAFKPIEKLNLQENPFFSTLVGTFDLNDIWAYLAGCALVWMLEFSNENKRPQRRKFF